jgi:hypothetical protein
MASLLPWNLRADFGGAGITVLRRPFPAHWPDCDNWDRKTMKEFTCGWCTITVCRRCRLLGVVCACHDGVVGIYGEARLRAWSLRMQASAELASWCCHVRLVMSQFFAGTPWVSCLSTHRCRCLGWRSWLQLCT